jgi:hypothetical protein
MALMSVMLTPMSLMAFLAVMSMMSSVPSMTGDMRDVLGYLNNYGALFLMDLGDCDVHGVLDPLDDYNFYDVFDG